MSTTPDELANIKIAITPGNGQLTAVISGLTNGSTTTVQATEGRTVVRESAKPVAPTPAPPTPPVPPTPPTPTPSSGLSIVPALAAQYTKVKTAYDFTTMTKLSADFNPCDGWANQNGLTTHASNITFDSVNGMSLLQPSKGSGAKVFTYDALFLPNEVVEAEVWVPLASDGVHAANWVAPLWTGQGESGPSPDNDIWPEDGENDFAEVLSGLLSSNYHCQAGSLYPSGTSNDTKSQSGWAGQWIKVSGERLAGSCNVYWTKQGQTPVLHRSYETNDPGAGETIVMCNGEGNYPLYTPAGATKIRNLKIFTQ